MVLIKKKNVPFVIKDTKFIRDMVKRELRVTRYELLVKS